MKYITLSDLSETIRRNLWKIPRDIDFIAGVPRSGMIAASLVSSYLNIPLIDVNSLVAGCQPSGGRRLRFFTRSHKTSGKVLVMDDTVYGGTSMARVRNMLRDVPGNFIFCCVYLEGSGRNAVDFFLEDVRSYTSRENPIVYYEWNIFQHNEDHTSRWLFDMDGVLCVDPPDERNVEAYKAYIADATPLFIPRSLIGGIVTYRLESNKEITQKWLERYGIQYKQLVMFSAETWEERAASGVSPEQFKAGFYAAAERCNLFFESDDRQARRIMEITGKPVFSVAANCIYQR